VKVQGLITWFQALLSVVLIFGFSLGNTAEDFALIRMSAVAVGSLCIIGIVLYDIRVLSLSSFLYALFRPVVAAAVMWVALDAIHPLLEGMFVGWRLSVEIVLGAVCYGAVVCLCWFIAGKPEGAETYLLSNVRLRYK